MRDLEKIRKTVEALTDKAGQKIDADILDLIVGLQAHAIPTQFSCFGHTDRQGSYPYVDIYDDDDDINFDDYSEANVTKKLAWIEANEKILAHLTRLLSEFYRNRNTPYEQLLVPHCSVDLNRIRLRTINAQLELAQAEMKAFGLFLQEKYTKDSIHS